MRRLLATILAGFAAVTGCAESPERGDPSDAGAQPASAPSDAADGSSHGAGLPQVRITTVGGAPIVDTEEYGLPSWRSAPQPGTR